MGLLSWLTRNGEGSRGGVTEPGTRARADAGTTPPGPDATPDAQVTGGWRSTPPVQRTLSAPMGLVTDPRGFGGRLGTWQDPTVTGPLGHLVSARAPSGVGHGLAEPMMPVQRMSVRPQAQAFGGSREAQNPVRGEDAGWADRPGDRPDDSHGTVGPTAQGTVSSPGPGLSVPEGVRAGAPVALPLASLQRTAVLPTAPARDTAPPAPAMVMRVPAVPAGPAPTRPLVVAEPPDEPARELTPVPASGPDPDPGPLTPDTPDEPVAGLLAAPDTPAGPDEVRGGVVQRTEASATARPTPVRDTPAPPLSLAAPRTGTTAGQGPDTALTAPLIGGVDGAGPAVQSVVQRDVAVPPRPRHRGLGEPLTALPPTALPRPGSTATPAESAAAPPSVASDTYVSRTVEVPETPAAPEIPTAPEESAVPVEPAVPDLGAGPAEPAVPSSDGEATAPLLGDTPPLTTDPVDLGTVLSPETVTDAGAEPVKLGQLPAPDTGPGMDTGPGLGTGSGPGSGTGFGLGSGSGSGAGFGLGSVPGSGVGSGAGTAPGVGLVPGPAPAPGPAVASGGAAPQGPVAVQRLDVLDVPGGSPPAPPVPPATAVTPVRAEADPAPLLGDAAPLAVSDTVAVEATGPGEMVTAATPMPMRRLDAVNAADAATLPGTPPETGAGSDAGPVAQGGGPVFPLVAQRSLPLYTVPEAAPSAEAPVASEPAAAVPVRWERAGGGPSAPGAGGSGGHAWSADTAPDGPRSGHTATGGGSAYPATATATATGHAGGVVQRATDAGTTAHADGAPSAWSYGDVGRPGRPEFPGVSAPGAAVRPDGLLQPATRALQGPDALGPPVPLQRLASVPGVAPSPVPHFATPSLPSPPLRGRAPSAPALSGVSAGAAAVAAGVAQWMPDGSVEFTAPAVQRAEDGASAGEPPADPPTPPEPAAPSAAEPSASTSAAAPGKTAGSGVPKVTDELVRALVAPLSRLLRAELRIERERAGTLIHTRH
ncbi:hypothetical protein [Streptomyces sp900129855]|uniref:Syndecan 1 n=1 Tax=Streptomyces sp. 900129855 TaxID=3155129 RepID=A0ABV2ZJ27_9ACTN